MTTPQAARLRRPAALSTRAKQTIGSIGLVLAVLAIWQVGSGLSFVIPTPAKTISVLVSNLGDPGYLQDLAATARAVAVAFVVGVVVGAIAGLVLGLSRWARIILEPLMIALNGLPKIVLYPVLLTIFSMSSAKVAMGVLFALFPVLINVETGVRQIPRVYWKLGRSLRASWWQMLLHIVLPGIMRPFLTGLRLAASLAIVGVVLSEFFATKRGLGRVVLQAYGSGDYPSMVATVLLLLAASFLISIALWRWERRVR